MIYNKNEAPSYGLTAGARLKEGEERGGGWGHAEFRYGAQARQEEQG